MLNGYGSGTAGRHEREIKGKGEMGFGHWALDTRFAYRLRCFAEPFAVYYAREYD